MSERVYGIKYNRNLSTKEIAGLVRTDIKNAIKKGELPEGLKVSVRYDSFSGGSAVRASVTAWPEGFLWLNPQWVIATKEQPNVYHERIPQYTKEAKVILGRIEGMREAYNHDGSDSMVDHFDVKYYGSTDVWWELEQPERDRIYKLWTTSDPQGKLDDVVLGDEVKFNRGELKGMHFIVADIGRNEGQKIHGGLCFELVNPKTGEGVFADGYDLNGIEIVKKVPAGMKVLRFKRKGKV